MIFIPNRISPEIKGESRAFFAKALLLINLFSLRRRAPQRYRSFKSFGWATNRYPIAIIGRSGSCKMNGFSFRFRILNRYASLNCFAAVYKVRSPIRRSQRRQCQEPHRLLRRPAAAPRRSLRLPTRYPASVRCLKEHRYRREETGCTRSGRKASVFRAVFGTAVSGFVFPAPGFPSYRSFDNLPSQNVPKGLPLYLIKDIKSKILPPKTEIFSKFFKKVSRPFESDSLRQQKRRGQPKAVRAV